MKWLEAQLQGDLPQRQDSWGELWGDLWGIVTNPLSWIFAVCFFVWHWKMRFRYGEQYLCMSKDTVVDEKQYFRIWTARMSHIDWTHLLANLWTLLCVLLHLDGSIIRPLFLVVCIWIVSTPIHFAIASGQKSWSQQLCMGFSDVIFGLMTYQGVTMYTTHRGLRSLFGPLWMLIIIQIRNPNSSFTGHLSGLLAGLLCYVGSVVLIFESLPLMIAVVVAWGVAGTYFWSHRPVDSALSRLGL